MECQSYQTRFFKNLEKVYDDIDKCHPDVTLHSMDDDVQKKCHRIVLSASSDYFTNVFSWSKSDVLEVHNGITGETIDTILRYIYSGKIVLCLDNVNDILVASNYFALPEIVELCIQFILDNVDIKSCLDMLLFSWQLDLAKLVEGITQFVTKFFSDILSDNILYMQLLSFPPDLMVILLQSNNLVITDLETNLPTRPAEREKRILEFILNYSSESKVKKCLKTCTSDHLSSLLRCVKWPILNIFDEEKYVLNTFSSSFDFGNREKEVKDLFNITHSEWYLSSSHFSKATGIDKTMYATRAFSCSELISLDVLADGGQISGSLAGSHIRATSTPEPFEIISKPDEHLSQLDVITRTWDGKTVVGGLVLHISSSNKEISKHHIGISEEKGSICTIKLKNGEHIVDVSANVGWLIDNLLFETSDKQTFGPFGGDGGSKRILNKTIVKYREEGGIFDDYDWKSSVVPGPHTRISLDSFLVGVTGKTIVTENELAITHLRFIFREMLPSSEFLINSTKKVERRLPFSNGSRLTPDSDYGDYYDDDDDYHHYDDDDDGYDYGDDGSYLGYDYSEYDDEDIETIIL